MMKFPAAIRRKAAAILGAALLAGAFPAMAEEEAPNHPAIAGYLNLTTLNSDERFVVPQLLLEEPEFELVDLALAASAGEAGFWVLEGKTGMALVTEDAEAAEVFYLLATLLDEGEVDGAQTVEFDGGIPGLILPGGETQPGRQTHLGCALANDNLLLAGLFESVEDVSFEAMLPPDSFDEIMSAVDSDDPLAVLVFDFKHPSSLSSDATLPFARGFLVVEPTEDDFDAHAVVECSDAEAAAMFETVLASYLAIPEIVPLLKVDRDGNSFTLILKNGTDAFMATAALKLQQKDE